MVKSLWQGDVRMNMVIGHHEGDCYCDTRIGQKAAGGVTVVAQWLTNLTRNHKVAGSDPALAQWVDHPALP